MEKTIRDAKQTIKEIDQLVDLYENRKSEISRELSALQQRMDHIEGQLSDETRRYVAPLVEQLKLASAERTQLERDLSRLEYQGKQRRYAIKLEEEALPQAEKDLEKVTVDLVELKKRIISPIDRSNAYMTHFRRFLRNVTLDLTLDSARWHEEEQVPYINGQPIRKAASGPDLAMSVLAFHYALLAMSLEQPKVKTNHPRFLIIDEAEQQKMGKLRYQQVLNLIGGLATRNRDRTQVIITTETQDIPEQFDQFAIEL